MPAELPENAKRVQNFLLDKGFSFDVKELPESARTAREAASSIGCNVSQIAKSLVFREGKTGAPILVIASGSNRVDTDKVETSTGLILCKADARFVKENVGFAIGGIPPVAHNEPIETLLDPDLRKYDVVWAAAGTPFAVFKLRPDDLAPLTNGRWVELSQVSRKLG
jgi:prolyl-tRNA editing enzyme YbaK/EbsC (Cys-tRNA(Pro) deacylase)